MDALEAIRRRRSTSRLAEPAPSPGQLQTILEAAVQAPDHKTLKPWRFVVLEGTNKDAFGEVLADSLLAREPQATAGQLDKERTKLGRAPMVIVAAAKRLETSLPFTELVAATSAAVENLLIAATALGFGSMWRTGAPAYDDRIKQALGFEPQDEVIGFIYLGTAAAPPGEPREPAIEDVVWHWNRTEAAQRGFIGNS